MRNRTTYADWDLVVAKEWSDVRKRGETLSQPLQLNNIGPREYDRLVKEAKVRPYQVPPSGTCATLLLQVGTPVHVVSERLATRK